MEEEKRKENVIVPETAAGGADVPNEATSSSTQPPAGVNNDSGPQDVRRREEPASLRRLSEAMEGWKIKQAELQRKLMEEFDHMGKDLSQMQHEAANFKSEIDIVKEGLQRRASVEMSHRVRTSVLAIRSKSTEDVPKSKDVPK
ncbi:hypothetical protein R1flu_009746 [Riccia fluitans]|uniref:Uncharacterized protein n=1 Tax=Riccia fluitans TaxID=41844 RepID=A0ABD1Z430_9MARC